MPRRREGSWPFPTAPAAGPGCYQGPAKAFSALWQLFVGVKREKHPGRGSRPPP